MTTASYNQAIEDAAKVAASFFDLRHSALSRAHGANIAQAIRALRQPASDTPDDLAVDRFAEAMKAKLALKRLQGRRGWDDPTECSGAFLSLLLVEHVEKGDPLDVGNLAMMLHQRGERIADERARYDEAVRKGRPASDTPDPRDEKTQTIFLNGRMVTLSGISLEVFHAMTEAEAAGSRDAFQRGFQGGLRAALSKGEGSGT